MSPPKGRENTITRYRLVEENMVGSVKEPVQNYDVMTTLMLCLGGPDDENYTGVLKLLDVLLSNDTGTAEKLEILQTDFDIPMTQTLERRLSNMCNLSDGVEAKGIEKGLQRGRVEGREEGIVQGTLSALKNMMGALNLSLDQAMAVLKIPEAERQQYVDLLSKQ